MKLCLFLSLIRFPLPSKTWSVWSPDLRGLLASKDLDSIPQIGALRDRIDEGLSRARESAVEAAQEAARQAREAAAAADRYAHDEPLGVLLVRHWRWGRWWAFYLPVVKSW